MPCLTRETEAAVVLLPCSFQAHLTGSGEGTPAPSDVIFYFLIIFPPLFFPPTRSLLLQVSRRRSRQLGQGNSGLSCVRATGSPSASGLLPPSPSTNTNPRKTNAPTHPEVFVLPKKKKIINVGIRAGGRPEEVSPCPSACVRLSPLPSLSPDARSSRKTLRHVTLLRPPLAA